MVVIGRVDELVKRQIQCVTILGNAYALIHHDESFYLLENECPHKSAALCEGVILHNEIRCPWHEARFDLRTGRGLTPLAGKGVKSLPVIIKQEELLADIT